MSEELEIYKAKQGGLVSAEMSMDTWRTIMEIAPAIHQSHLFGVSSPEQAASIMMKGREMGLGLVASFEFIQVIKGHVGLAPKGALALLHTSPKVKQIKVTRLVDAAGKFVGYECEMSRKDTSFSFTSRWTMMDAQRAGLVKPDSGWLNYPENMCLWRAIGFCADVVFPDITAGMNDFLIRPEQFDIALSEDGEIIKPNEMQTKVVDGVEMGDPTMGYQPIAPTVAPTSAVTLEDLINQYGAEAILNANEGRIPGTDAELMQCAETLGKGG